MKDLLRSGKLVTLMLGHLTVDSYVGVIPILYPVLIGRFHLTLATVGLVSLAYSGAAAISQPLFGVIADRYGTRFTGVALAWTAVTFALVGFVPTFPLLVVLACASGLGSGAFHPFGALDVRALLQAWRRNFGMSVYVTAGTVGVALGPLIGIGVLALFGLHGTGLLVIPGVAAGAYLLWRMRDQVRPTGAAAKAAALTARPVPIFALVLASAVGTVGCGSLADRYGRRNVILATLVLTIPAILLYTMFPGPWAFASAILIGFLAASTAPLMLVMAQQLMASRAGLASGLVMGLGFVTAAIGIPINGAIADAVGLQESLMSQVILVAGTLVLAWFLPGEKDMETFADVVPAVRPAAAGVPTVP